MNLQEIQHHVISIAVEAFDLESTPEKVTVVSSLMEDLNANWFKINEFMIDLEIKFDIDIPYEDVENIITVQGAIDYIADALGVTA